ncbi:DEAD/DEAH box helicase [Hyperthermus butylicus]|nr:DEAD/DEAH box helicase [Hyperthermus butylicus]
MQSRLEFEGAMSLLHEKVRELIRLRGWRELTEIQEKAIKPILEGHNVFIVAPTGYGKTEAALLPILSRMLEERVEPVALLYITPLRALINDIYERISWWASRFGFIVARKHGDVPHSERTRRLRHAPHILVTTPESLEIDLDWAPKFRQYYRNLRWVIVDEVHEIVSNKRGVQLAVLLERFRRIAGDFQLIMISATIGEPTIAARAFTGSSRRPLTVVSVEKRKPIEIVVDYVEAPSTKFWRAAAEKLVKHMEPLTLVFVNSKHAAEKLHGEIERMGVEGVVVHHASIHGEERRRIEKMAKEGKLNMIIATKTLELGIDIGSIRKVILFRPAGSVSSLLQRLGRSGHTIAGKISGIVLATDPLELLEAIAEARLAAKGKVEVPELPVKPLDMVARAILGMALSGEYTVNDMYDILSKVYYFRGLTRSEFDELIDYLKNAKMIKINNDGKVSCGPQFYKIWRFDAGDSKYSWWVQNFSQFFTTIGERRAYTVRTVDGRVVGELDTDFVVKVLRVGHVIRLGGRNWQVIGIDEHNGKVVVAETEQSITAIPFWKGKGPELSRLVIAELEKVIQETHRGQLNIPSSVKLTESAAAVLNGIIGEVRKYRYPAPARNKVIVEKLADEDVYVVLAPERVVRTLAYLVMLEAYRSSSDVYVKLNHYGFAVPSHSIAFNPLKFLVSLTREEFEERLREAVTRSPYFAEEAHNIQLVFGVTRKIKRSDGVAFEEIARQTLQNYFDPEAAWELIQGIREGRIKIVFNQSRTSMYARSVVEEVPEKPWVGDVGELIAETLEGMAFTVEELADAIGVPPEIVESKLRDLGKPGADNRVFYFIDVDTGEIRWGLVRDAAGIAVSEEFSSSFTPLQQDGLYLVLVKSENGTLIHAIVRVAEFVRNPEKLLEQIPFHEIHEVKVVPLTGYYEGQAPRYQQVPREIVPYLVLNAIAFIQKMQMSNPLI